MELKKGKSCSMYLKTVSVISVRSKGVLTSLKTSDKAIHLVIYLCVINFLLA